jgi:hypothetical protein
VYLTRNVPHSWPFRGQQNRLQQQQQTQLDPQLEKQQDEPLPVGLIDILTHINTYFMYFVEKDGKQIEEIFFSKLIFL